jgi:hypothetical protein
MNRPRVWPLLRVRSSISRSGMPFSAMFQCVVPQEVAVFVQVRWVVEIGALLEPRCAQVADLGQLPAYALTGAARADRPWPA